MQTEIEMVDVMFRVDRGGVVFALMPGLAGTNDLATCTSYQHVGQHSPADLAYCVCTSRPAKPEEYGPLLRELQGRGYVLNVVSRATKRHHAERAKQL